MNHPVRRENDSPAFAISKSSTTPSSEKHFEFDRFDVHPGDRRRFGRVRRVPIELRGEVGNPDFDVRGSSSQSNDRTSRTRSIEFAKMSFQNSAEMKASRAMPKNPRRRCTPKPGFKKPTRTYHRKYPRHGSRTARRNRRNSNATLRRLHRYRTSTSTQLFRRRTTTTPVQQRNREGRNSHRERSKAIEPNSNRASPGQHRTRVASEITPSTQRAREWNTSRRNTTPINSAIGQREIDATDTAFAEGRSPTRGGGTGRKRSGTFDSDTTESDLLAWGNGGGGYANSAAPGKGFAPSRACGYDGTPQIRTRFPPSDAKNDEPSHVVFGVTLTTDQ